MRNPRHGAAELTVREDDGRVLSSHLDAARNPQLSASHGNLAAAARRPGEDASVGLGVQECLAHLFSTEGHLQHSGWKVFGEQASKPTARPWRVLTRLEHHGIARHQRRKHRAVEARDWVIPRGEDGHDAARHQIHEGALLWKTESVQRNFPAFEGWLQKGSPPFDSVQRTQRFIEKRLGLDFANFLLHQRDNLVAPRQHLLRGADKVRQSLGKRLLAPSSLCGPGPRHELQKCTQRRGLLRFERMQLPRGNALRL